MSAIENAKQLLREMGDIFLITFKEDGMPDARAISAVKSDGFKTIWMISHAGSTKAEELERDPRCMIYATRMADDAEYAELRLWGTAEVLSDRASVCFAWHDIYKDYFPQGKDDPQVRVMKFTARSGSLGTPTGRQALDL